MEGSQHEVDDEERMMAHDLTVNFVQLNNSRIVFHLHSLVPARFRQPEDMIWDDSALIDAYNQAVEQYKVASLLTQRSTDGRCC